MEPGQVIVLVHLYSVSVLEAKILLILHLFVREHEPVDMLLITKVQVVDVSEVPVAAAVVRGLVAKEFDIRVVHDVKAVGQIGQAEHEVEAVVHGAEGDIMVSHFLGVV